MPANRGLPPFPASFVSHLNVKITFRLFCYLYLCGVEIKKRIRDGNKRKKFERIRTSGRNGGEDKYEANTYGNGISIIFWGFVTCLALQ